MNRSSIKTYLNKSIEPSNKPWLNIIIISIIVYFILVVFQPFGLYNFKPSQLFKIAFLYAIATAVATSIVAYLLPLVFPKCYNPTTWTIGRKIINQFILIGLIVIGNYLVSYLLGFRHMPTAGSVILSYIVITLTVGIFPAFIIAFFEQNYSLKKNLREAQKLNLILSEKVEKKQSPINSEIQIKLSATTKDSIALFSNQIVYIESVGNYTNINYVDENKIIKQKQLRLTLSAAEKELLPFSNFIRCHRAFIVNADFIINAEGNSAGLEIRLKNIKNKIPVSRSHVAKIYNESK